MNFDKCISLAINNIIKFGDTDIFPFSIENIIFEEKVEELIKHFKKDINKLNKDEFKQYLANNTPANFSTVCPVGYTGYRWATIIDPYWNAYFLALVISIADKIEEKRLSHEYVYSYRYDPQIESGKLFNTGLGWRKFQEESINLCENNNEYKYIISCDIADFYPRIYHHRLENELDRIGSSNPSLLANIHHIKILLQNFSKTKSYGLPVGGPASRILAELALDATDKLLLLQKIKFKRFVDDYLIFCKTKEEAHSLLTFLNIKLIENEGLTLQKNKSLIMSKEEFTKIARSKIYGINEDEGSAEKAKFLSLPVRFDPYSPNAVQDYEDIKSSLVNFDLYTMLNEELQKSKINQFYTRHLIKALKFANEQVLSNSFIIMFDNIAELYPIFNTIIQTAINQWERLDEKSKRHIFLIIENLVSQKSYLIQTDVNLAFTIKLLSLFNTIESSILLNDIYERTKASLVKKLITQAMAKQNNHSWLSDIKNTYSTQDELQKRIFIICSYLLGDEGEHWRTHNQKGFTPIQKIYKDWASSRKQSSKTIGSAL
ncbi:RNA-directed DNA polymerase [Acinetobacter baumannii]|nr:RNA-directed DNA polymerase [Acinetobacter baumannii]